MARGRPVLATLLMTTGIIALAVPGSVAFAGEFLILAGVYGVGWGWAVVGAGGDRARRDVHAAADLGRAPRGRGRDVREDAPDVRPSELAIVVPLVALLLVLSAWPALDLRALVPRSAASRRRRRRDPDPEGRLARARADAGAARPPRAWPCSAACSCPGGCAASSPRSSSSPASSPRASSPRSSSTRRRGPLADRRVVHARPARRVRGADHRRRRRAHRPRLLGRAAARPRRRVLRAPGRGRARAWSSSSPPRT